MVYNTILKLYTYEYKKCINKTVTQIKNIKMYTRKYIMYTSFGWNHFRCLII